ncbi:MAG: response regulator [Anaerolineae bacterium]|nr:response regulator [Anaerolineae bacterium]
MKDKSEQLILVLEADEYMRESMVEIFELEGYCVAAAADGVTGLAEARKLRPDLIVCNVALSGLNGYEVFDALQADAETVSLPFVFLVLRRSDSPAFRSGIGDYLTAPLDPQDLLATAAARL